MDKTRNTVKQQLYRAKQYEADLEHFKKMALYQIEEPERLKQL